MTESLPTSNLAASHNPDFATGVYTFLNALPPNTLGRLYTSPASCLAIFRLLPPIARHLVLNMVWIETPLTKSDVEMWAGTTKAGKRQLEETVMKLAQLHILHEATSQVALNGRAKAKSLPTILYNLDVAFREHFRRALTGGGDHQSFGVACGENSAEADMDRSSIADLDVYGTQKWETILHFMVGSELQSQPSPRVLALLQHSGLMVPTSKSKSMQITSRGFQFLLADANAQLWDLLLQYLGMAETNNMDLVDVLSCIFMLGSSELGREYSLENLPVTQRQVLTDLVDFGLIKMHMSTRYYPTRLATTLTSSADPIVQSHENQADRGFLILETNYRIYAYTSNPLQIAVLKLFISLRFRFPNLVVGAITRDSIKKALGDGITADQIIAYLSVHAHPQMRKHDPLLPPTVVDQIKLWELEKNRIHDESGFLYEDFKSAQDFDLVIQYARQVGVILWENEAARKFFVVPEGHNVLREFIKRRMGGE